jgi:hypothetical protein
MKIVMISDTHGAHPALPPGDLLAHCGDLTHFGSFAELRAEVEWLKSLLFRHVILIGGNHDIALGNLCDKKLEDQTRKLLFGHIHYLRDSGVTVEGVRFWGTPWIPPYAGVFNLPEDELREKMGCHSLRHRCAHHARSASRHTRWRNWKREFDSGSAEDPTDDSLLRSCA